MPIVYNTESTSLPSLSILDSVNMIRSDGSERVAGVLESIHDTVNALSAALGNASEGRFDQLYVTDSQTGEVIGKIGSFEELSGAAFIRLWVGGNVDDPENTAPLYVDNNGKVQIVLGDTDDAAALEVLDGSGNRVVWMGKDGSNYGIAAENIWIGPGADPATAPFWSDGTGTYIGKNGYVVVLDDDTPTPNQVAWIGVRDFGSPGSPDIYYGAGFENLYIGPGADPTTSPFFCDGTNLIMGQNGFILLLDDTEAEVGWFGVRDFGGTDYKGAHIVNLRVAGDITDPTTAKLVADETGISLIDASIQITAGTTVTTLDAVNGLVIEGETSASNLNTGYLEVTLVGSPADRTGTYNANRHRIQYTNTGASIDAQVTSSKAQQTIADGAGAYVDIDTSAGLDIGGMSILFSGVTAIDSSRNASFASLALATDLPITEGGTGAGSASGARTNLDVYSTTQVDSAIAAALSGYATQAWVLSQLANYVSTTTFSGHRHQVSGVQAGASTINSGFPF